MTTFKVLTEGLLKESYGEVLNRHGYTPLGDGPEDNWIKRKIEHNVDLDPRGGWAHKGKNKNIVPTIGESPESLDRHLRSVASRLKSAKKTAASTKQRNDYMKSIGMTKTSGGQWE